MAQFPQTLESTPTVPSGFRADLRRWRQLVSVDWLAALLKHQAVAAPPTQHWRLLEVACDGLEAFLASHIPGAQYLDTRQLEHLPFWNALPQHALLPVFQDFGIGADTTVILYGRNTLAAARAAQILLACGANDVRLLDGGFKAWCDSGYVLGHGNAPAPAPAPAPARALAAESWVARPGYLIHTAEARALRTQANSALVTRVRRFLPEFRACAEGCSL